MHHTFNIELILALEKQSTYPVETVGLLSSKGSKSNKLKKLGVELYEKLKTLLKFLVKQLEKITSPFVNYFLKQAETNSETVKAIEPKTLGTVRAVKVSEFDYTIQQRIATVADPNDDDWFFKYPTAVLNYLSYSLDVQEAMWGSCYTYFNQQIDNHLNGEAIKLGFSLKFKRRGNKVAYPYIFEAPGFSRFEIIEREPSSPKFFNAKLEVQPKTSKLKEYFTKEKQVTTDTEKPLKALLSYDYVGKEKAFDKYLKRESEAFVRKLGKLEKVNDPNIAELYALNLKVTNTLTEITTRLVKYRVNALAISQKIVRDYVNLVKA